MSSFDTSLYDYDCGYFEYMPNFWLPGKLIPGSTFGCVSRRAVETAITAELKDTDILVGTYMKTGQTWTMTILRLILSAQDVAQGKKMDFKDFYDRMPFMEIEAPNGETGADKLKRLEGQRFLKTHLPYPLWKNTLAKHPNMKVIQTLRNPKDTLVSLYHHVRSDGLCGAFNSTWDQFFEVLKAERGPWGDYFKVNAEWYKFNKDRENSLVVKYEDMKKDHRGHVIKIAKFLGVDLDEKTIDRIVEESTIKSMSKKFEVVEKDDETWKSERSNFIRKGIVGDWVNYFSKEQSEYVDAKTKEYLEPLGITFEY